MSLIRSHRSPVELARAAGRIPVAAAALVALSTAGVAFGQNLAGGSPSMGRLSMPGQPAARTGQAGGGQPDGPRVRVSEHNTVDLHVKDEDLANVLELLSVQTQRNIIPSKNVSARVTAALYNVTFYEALDAILHVNGFGYIEQGNFIYVYTLQEIEEIQKALSKRVAKVIRLNYLNAADAADFVKPLLSQGGDIRTSAKADNFAIPDNAPVGGENWALGATLVVIDYEQNIEAVERLIAELDTKPAQVLVEATVLQTALTEANAFGVDFSIIGDLNFTDFIGVGGPRRAADALILGGAGTAGQGVSPADNRGVAASSIPGNTEGRATFKLGVIADDVSVFMRLLDEVSDTTIISNPKILALNRMPARVLVGRRVGYLSTTATDTSTTQTVSFLDTGTQLYFRPFVARDNSIRMELKPQVSEAIIRQANDATGAAVSIPDEVTQEITTNVIVRDGQTIVLGGLFRESTQFTRRQVPFLGDIPIIGAAFRGNEDDTQRSEIIFMIKPSIVTDAVIDQAAARASQDIERLRAGSRQGLLPWSREKMTSIHNLEAEHLARAGKHDKALWHLQQSLALNPNQPDAFRLRERITGEAEIWPDRSLLEDVMGQETTRQIERITPPSQPQTHYKPYGHHPVPREVVAPPALRPPVEADPMFDDGASKPVENPRPQAKAQPSQPERFTETPSTPEPVVASGDAGAQNPEIVKIVSEPATAPAAAPAPSKRPARELTAAELGVVPTSASAAKPAPKVEPAAPAPAVATKESAPSAQAPTVAVSAGHEDWLAADLLDQEFNQRRLASMPGEIPQPVFSPWFGGMTSRGFLTAIDGLFFSNNLPRGAQPSGNGGTAVSNVPTTK